MSTATARDMSDDEIRELTVRLRERDRRIDAGLPPDRPRADAASRSKRKPLAFIEPIVAEDVDNKADDPTGGWPGFNFRHEAHGSRPEDALRSDWTFRFLDTIGAVMIALNNDTVRDIDALQDRLATKFREVEAARRTEAAEFKAVIAELRGEVASLRAIQESQRIQSRGEQGVAGPRGIPGAQGPAGPRGEQGERGAPARETVAWDVDASRFAVTPCHSDSTRGVPLNLLGLFQAYDNAVSELEDRDLVDAAQASRDALEAEVKRSAMRG
jgi:hypothetical protein